MKQLSGLDATFLFLETREMPMHVGALHVFELPPGHRGRFVTALRRHIASRLPVAPALRRKLWWMPLNLANPAWVDAEPDLNEHIVEVKLPKVPGGASIEMLEAEVGRLHPVLLDRKRPLWKFHVFEGLAPSPSGAKRVALYTQLHHAAVDGQAAVALANAILDLSPVPRTIDQPASKRQKAYRLEMTEMLRGVLGNQAQKIAQIVKELPSTVGTLGGAAGQVISRSSLLTGNKGVSNVAVAPRTALNVSVTEGRAFATVTLPLPEVREIGRAGDATINDMVLMLVSSALRRHLAKQRALPKKSLIAAVPISLRAKGDTSSDNQASMSLVSLGTHIGDSKKRLAHIKAATGAMKSTMGSLKSVLPTDFPSLGVPWLIEAATALYGRAKVAERIPQFANLVISNVPGPPVPLFMAGARMLTNYPASIVVHGIALNITVQSYDQSLDFGLMADAAAMPDVKALAQAIHGAFDELRALPGEADADAAGDGLVQQARRRIGSVTDKVTGKVTGAVSGAVAGAVTNAVGNVVGSVAKGLIGGALKSAVAKATSKPSTTAGKPRAERSKARDKPETAAATARRQGARR